MNKTNTGFVIHGSHDASKYEPFPVGTVQWIRRPGEGGRENLSSGFWQATPEQAPEPFEVISAGDETVLILEGAIRIEPAEGETFTLRAGDTASFNHGSRCIWTVLEPTREFFVYA